MIVSRIWNLWFQDGNTKRRAESERTFINSSTEDRHATRMDWMDHADTSHTLSQELRSFKREQVSVRTVR
ncbi:hypothetical protein TNCV_256731 [Trichonephila clavipes]|nr:hypothetical protein TNCV_256731 [Trichonephila clavipes]